MKKNLVLFYFNINEESSKICCLRAAIEKYDFFPPYPSAILLYSFRYFQTLTAL